MMPLPFLCNKYLTEYCSDKTDCDLTNCNQLGLKYFCCDDIKSQKGYQSNLSLMMPLEFLIKIKLVF